MTPVFVPLYILIDISSALLLRSSGATVQGHIMRMRNLVVTSVLFLAYSTII